MSSPSTPPLKAAARASSRAFSATTNNELVSSDFKGNPLSSHRRRPSHQGHRQTRVKVLSWYDNEWGYSNRVVDLIGFLVKKGL